MTDEELLKREPIARILAWDMKTGNYSRAADDWFALHAECQSRGLQSSVTWPDFWPTSPRAKALRVEAGLRDPKTTEPSPKP